MFEEIILKKKKKNFTDMGKEIDTQSRKSRKSHTEIDQKRNIPKLISQTNKNPTQWKNIKISKE